MSTVRELIKGSLKLLGAIGQGETPSADEQADGLLSLNQMLESWSNESLYIYTKPREEFSLVVGQQTYTVGTAGNFNTSRPQKIENAGIILAGASDDQETPMRIIGKDEWARITSKDVDGGTPAYLYAEGTYPLERINLWPKPGAVDTIVLYSWKPLTTFATVDTEISLPLGYLRAIRSNLALELAPEYGKSVSSELMAIAVESKENIKRMNIKPLFLDCDPASLARNDRFNIYTGE